VGADGAVDGPGDGNCLSGRFTAVGAGADDLREIIDAENTQVRDAFERRQTEWIPSDRRVRGDLDADLELGRILAVLVLGGDHELGGNAQRDASGLGELGARGDEVEGHAPLDARRERVDRRRLRIGGGRWLLAPAGAGVGQMAGYRHDTKDK